MHVNHRAIVININRREPPHTQRYSNNTVTRLAMNAHATSLFTWPCFETVRTKFHPKNCNIWCKSKTVMHMHICAATTRVEQSKPKCICTWCTTRRAAQPEVRVCVCVREGETKSTANGAHQYSPYKRIIHVFVVPSALAPRMHSFIRCG